MARLLQFPSSESPQHFAVRPLIFGREMTIDSVHEFDIIVLHDDRIQCFDLIEMQADTFEPEFMDFLQERGIQF